MKTEITEKWKSELGAAGSREKAQILSRFFKTGKGEYGEGDIFVGITVPINRSISKKYFEADFNDIAVMLASPIHEYRLSGLLALVEKYKKQKTMRADIVRFYLDHTAAINNWDLVDLSAPYIVGDYWNENYDATTIDRLSYAESIWDRRIAIVATLMMIRKGNHSPALMLSERYLGDKHPLIHKATGWMLRETGKKNREALINFLDRFAPSMPRTALRYAIEHLDKETRVHYMKMKPDSKSRLS
ncbi:MAG: DNA alkylation repair protein [Muribaculaceae bacterium]|nr:DNA alkylation repair protein [Muribaculaceae bacterium]